MTGWTYTFKYNGAQEQRGLKDGHCPVFDIGPLDGRSPFPYFIYSCQSRAWWNNKKQSAGVCTVEVNPRRHKKKNHFSQKEDQQWGFRTAWEVCMPWISQQHSHPCFSHCDVSRCLQWTIPSGSYLFFTERVNTRLFRSKHWSFIIHAALL